MDKGTYSLKGVEIVKDLGEKWPCAVKRFAQPADLTQKVRSSQTPAGTQIS